MKNCLVTKLKSAVNQDLEILGESKVSIKFTDSNVGVIYLKCVSPVKITTDGNNIRLGSSGNFTNEVNVPVTSNVQTLQVSGECVLKIKNKYDLLQFTFSSNNIYTDNESVFYNYWVNLASFKVKWGFVGALPITFNGEMTELSSFTIQNGTGFRPQGSIMDFAKCGKLTSLIVTSSLFAYGERVEDFAEAMLPNRDLGAGPLQLTLDASAMTYNGEAIKRCTIIFSANSYTVSDIIV